MKDSFGRKINYLRISVTDLCNLRCKYCMPESGINKKCHNQILRNEEIIEIVKIMSELGIDKVRITGGEPLIRKGIVDIIKEISRLEGIKEVVMTTNGELLEDKAKDLKDAGLDRVNISLDTFDKDKFISITRRDSLDKVLRGIDKAIEVGLDPVKINTVLMGGINDDEIEKFVSLTKDKPIDVRFIELMPIGEAGNWSKERFISTGEVLKRVPELTPVIGKDISSPAKYYKLHESIGIVGLIDPISCSFCTNCNRIRVTSDGKLKLCLHSDIEIDLLTALREGKDVKKLILESIKVKPEKHLMESEDFTPITRNMNRIGG